MPNRLKFLTWALPAIAVLFFNFINSRPAEAQAPSATISGTVTDATGAVVAGAKVDVKNVDTTVTLSVETNAQGRYTAPTLPIGNYEVQVSQSGFETAVRTGIVLSVGNEAVVDFALTVGQSQQTVTVSGEVSQVETTSSTVSSLVDQAQMRELPLNGRNVEQLILLAPGVQTYNGFTSGAFFGAKANGYSISGSRPEGQALLLDNQNVQNFWGHGMGSPTLGTSFGIESVAEFQTLTGVYSAQFGGNGAAVNQVSKSGTNSFHGSGYEFLRNSDLDARNFFDKASVPPFRRNQFGGSVGGPVKKDKAFFFANYEGLRQLLSETKVADVPDANAHAGFLPCATASSFTCNSATGLANVGVAPGVVATLAAFPLPTQELTGGIGSIVENANQIGNENYLLSRFDYTLSAKDAFYVRYVLDFVNLHEPFPVSNLPIWQEQDTTRNQFVTIEERRIVSPTLVNTARVSYSRPVATGTTVTGNEGFDFFPGSGRQNGSISVPGLTSTGPTSQAPYNLSVNRFIEGDDVIWTHGAHSVKFGFVVTRKDTNTLNFFREGGAWTFTSLANFLQGVSSQLNGILPGAAYGNRDIRETPIEPYIHDEWKISPTLTLNIGVRYEWDTNPTDAHNQLYEIVNPQAGNAFTHVSHLYQDGNPARWNFDPRAGLAWDPFKDHKTSVRAGFGLYHDLIDHTFFPSIWSSPPEVSAVQINPTSFPIPFTSTTPSPLQDSPGFDYRVNTTPYMVQWNLNVQREVASNTTLTVGYQGSRGIHLLDPIDQNPVTITPDGLWAHITGPKTLTPNPRIDPAYSELYDDDTIGLSMYHAMQVGLVRRFTSAATVQLSYTWSHCLDNGSIWTGAEGSNAGANPNAYDLHADYGNCSFDIREALRINGLYNLPFRGNKFVSGWQLSGILTLADGVYISPTNGFDQQGDSTTTRPNYNPSCTNLVLGRPTQWFNPACFSEPEPGTPGNLGRTDVPGPNIKNLDFSILKDTRIPKISEAFDVQFRAEFFNIFNRANFALPTATIYSLGSYSIVNGVPTSTVTVAPTAGQITATATTSRQIQFGVKILF
jgi:hypothetical protein